MRLDTFYLDEGNLSKAEIARRLGVRRATI
ncbi:hypothetical protein [Lysinibacillus xylanilyticus]